MAFHTDFRFWNYKDATGNKRPNPPPQRMYGPVSYIGPLTVCAYLVETSDGLVVVDTACETDSHLLENNIRVLGCDPRNIKVILLTHWHWDHVGGTKHLVELSGAEVYVHEYDAEIARTGIYRGQRKNPELKRVRTLVDGQVIECGGVKFKTHFLPGQSAGEVGYSTTVPGPDGLCRVFFAGDSTGFKDDVKTLEYLAYPGVCEDYRRTVEKLKQLEFDLFCGGHPHQILGECNDSGNPFVTREEWLKHVKNRHAQMERFVKEHPHYLNKNDWSGEGRQCR